MVAQQGKALGIQLVNAACPFMAVADQAGLFKHAQMLRNGRARDRQTRGELVHGLGVRAQHFKDGQAGGIAQGRETVLYVSIHLR